MTMPLTSGPVRKLPDRVGIAAATRSIRLLWWLPVSPIVGFLGAELFLSASWPLWQVVPLAILLATPFAVGACYGAQAVLHGNRRGWIGLIPHLAFAVLAIVMPISESLAM